MDIKKLYTDLCVLVGEIPIYSFLTYCDMCARSLMARYGEKYAVGDGGYTTPTSLSDSFAIDSAFYTAVLYFAAGKALGDSAYLEKSALDADLAYRGIWRGQASGKRIKGAKW